MGKTNIPTEVVVKFPEKQDPEVYAKFRNTVKLMILENMKRKIFSEEISIENKRRY